MPLATVLPDAVLATIAATAAGPAGPTGPASPAGPARKWTVEPVDYPFGTPTSVGAVRLHGADPPWSRFVKVVQAYRHWPLFDTIPPDFRTAALESPLWRYEADVYLSRVGDLLPRGLRLPVTHDVIDLGDDRIAIVMEDVTVKSGTVWTEARFAHAANLLGRTAIRLTRHDALPAQASREPGFMTALYYRSRLLTAELPMLADDRTWAHPLFAARERDLRPDLTELARRIPAVLDRLKALPQLMYHGDASPQNLLVPADRPDTFVAIDWSIGGVAAPGDDLGQLLIGLAHAGQLGVRELAPLRNIIVDAYTAGLRAETPTGERTWDEATVRYGLDGGLLARSTFASLPLDRLHEPLTDELAAHIEHRLALTRYLVDLGLALEH